jgi:hypothetical protein
MSMRTIEIKYDRIPEAAAKLVANAPARGDYWGVTLRARYATTNPADIEAHYRRTLALRGHVYGVCLPAAQRARLVCGKCGAQGCKMWREYQTFANKTDVLCGPCALAKEGKAGPIDSEGQIRSDLCGKIDSIGWMTPAVPDLEGRGFWGRGHVPEHAVAWWRALPSYPSAVRH